MTFPRFAPLAVLIVVALVSCAESPIGTDEEKTSIDSESVSETSPPAPESELLESGTDQPPVEEEKTVADTTPMKESTNQITEGTNFGIATFAGGCFWCTEAVFEKIEGVIDVVSGYIGGHVENPTYEQICTKTTGHAEAIQIRYDKSKITYEELLDIFWQAHDPTTLNRQGNDRGPQYRSAIFYHTPEQKNQAEQSKAKLDSSGYYSDPAVTEIVEASKFWVAEGYHQDYYEQNKDSNPYCRIVITPKMKKLGLE